MVTQGKTDNSRHCVGRRGYGLCIPRYRAPKGKCGQIPKGGVEAGTAWGEGNMAYASPGTVPPKGKCEQIPKGGVEAGTACFRYSIGSTTNVSPWISMTVTAIPVGREDVPSVMASNSVKEPWMVNVTLPPRRLSGGMGI